MLEKPLPIGTIRVGEGLTDSQKENLNEREAWSKLLSALHGISWLRTQEGNMFWRVLADRATNVYHCMGEEKKRIEARNLAAALNNHVESTRRRRSKENSPKREKEALQTV